MEQLIKTLFKSLDIKRKIDRKKGKNEKENNKKKV